MDLPARRHELKDMTQPALCALYRNLGYLGGMHPLESWHRDELIESILAVEMAENTPAAGCDVCRQPGWWCGDGGVVTTQSRPCVCCGEPTVIRSQCGAARTARCLGAAPVEPAPTRPASTPAAPRAARTERRPRARATEQDTATDAAIAALATGQPLRLLTALEGAFAPLKVVGGRRCKPRWRTELPGMTYAAHVVTGYQWSRPFTGRACVLDRSGAWVAAASSVEVAHDTLEHTGACEFTGRPGYYQMYVYPWYEQAVMPSPLGNAKPDTTVWLPAPTVALLRDLVDQGRWPDVAVLDSYTGDPCRLTDWTGHCNKLRAHAITTFGRDSNEYKLVKEAFGQAMSLMLGHVGDDRRRHWDCLAARPDITHGIQAQGSATLWRWGDDCRRVAPELPPVALRNIDELIVPVDAVPILTSTPRPGGRKPLVIDPDGIMLGSFKIKDTEEWAA